ncbi:hypothetical protein R1sor_022957 [Riccia sorocarpa]|uniref:THUMP domain-containing protein n=1 Tax=Riccia sorocarpa TaxID=122646 RepID=A0ABD3GMV8_9MARC
MTTAKEEETERAMEPWEQHHSIINMPRYAYNAAAVLQKQNVGFLITCTFRREKSATKEALALFREYMKVTEASNDVVATMKTKTSSLGKAAEKRVKLLDPSSVTAEESTGEKLPAGDFKSPSVEAEEAPAEDRTSAAPATRDVTNADSSVTKENGEAGKPKNESVHSGVDEDKASSEAQEFVLMKLDTMGVIYILATNESTESVLSIVSRILKDVQTSSRPPPKWCHRILPVQGTCSTKPEELQELVFRLVKQHLESTSFSGDQPLNYAVAFNRRGAEGSAEKKSFDRGECIKVVTAAVNQVTPSVKVDLTSPKMVVVVELIPVAGISSLVCAVSVLPGDLVISKPKLTVKPLVPESRKRKHH